MIRCVILLILCCAYLPSLAQLPDDYFQKLPLSQPDTIHLGFSEEIDKRYGFRGLRFETPFQQIKGLQYTGSSGPHKLYRKVPENKTLGNCKLDAVLYAFYKGRLASILVTTSGDDNSVELIRMLTLAYGEPFHEEESDKWLWEGKKAVALFGVNDDGSTSVYISSKIMSTQLERDENTRRQRAASGL
ncbi:hypothetical protein F0P96_10600 [Hymenobacter busanensis]|uniref:Uncharacterized protein n=1 Tax=Hymenobacter busanensis TaxID=2607656 RepID=A0A7L5A2B6_9BACT|nr:hypothetical protein [Hymenobacter busanensis]KAA9333410.1 hypothetical protein F0P96_10600 [Hymenobacter busanensis]QHJ07910.1 hypothetical protein GUY19_11705 [Hymenobacter busanensis]